MNRKNIITLSVCGLLLAALSGCTSAPKIESEFDPAEDFTAHKSYYVVPFPETIPNVDPGTLMRIAPAAQTATETGMAAKGYTKAANVDSADLLVVIHGKSVPKTELYNNYTPTYAGAWGYGRYPYAAYNMNTVSVDNYDEGTLILEMHERATKQMIWVGWTTGRVKSDTSGQAERVASLIGLILDQYPNQGIDGATWKAMGGK
jgi:hypothetical protein